MFTLSSYCLYFSMRTHLRTTWRCWYSSVTVYISVRGHIWGLPGDADTVWLRDSVLLSLPDGRHVCAAQQHHRGAIRRLQALHDLPATFRGQSREHRRMAGQIVVFSFLTLVSNLLDTVKCSLAISSMNFHLSPGPPSWEILKKGYGPLHNFVKSKVLFHKILNVVGLCPEDCSWLNVYHVQCSPAYSSSGSANDTHYSSRV